MLLCCPYGQFVYLVVKTNSLFIKFAEAFKKISQQLF